MSPLNPVQYHRHLQISVLAEIFFAFLTTIFSRTCLSDGCIGVAFFGGIAIAIFLFQVIVLIPIYAYRRKRAGERYLKNSFTWLLMVTLVLLIAMLLNRDDYGLFWVVQVAPILFSELL